MKSEKIVGTHPSEIHSVSRNCSKMEPLQTKIGWSILNMLFGVNLVYNTNFFITYPTICSIFYLYLQILTKMKKKTCQGWSRDRSQFFRPGALCPGFQTNCQTKKTFDPSTSPQNKRQRAISPNQQETVMSDSEALLCIDSLSADLPDPPPSLIGRRNGQLGS